MRIKTNEKKSFLEGLKKLAVGPKIAIIASAVVVIGGGVYATVYAITNNDGQDPSVPAINSSTTSSDGVSSELTSSDLTSSDDMSSSDESTISSGTEETESATTSSKKVTSSNASSIVAASGDTSSKATSSTPSPQTVEMPEGYQEKYAEYYKSNKDIAGWINLPGTKLDYPVAQGNDNYYYLNKNIYKEQSAWGVPYMDYTVAHTPDSQSTNTILYGHSDDKRGLQCSAVKGYRNVDFYKQHPTIDFDSVYSDGTYKIVSFFITNQNAGNWFPYHTFIEGGEQDVLNYVAQAKERSYINTNVDVVGTDKLLTIQTCEDTNASNFNRLVLVARKVRPGEDASVDTSGAAQNANQVLPK